VSGIVEGRQWLEQRIRFLEAELEGDVSGGSRALIEVELATLREELRTTRRRRWIWFLWGGRL
jgi:hypothetical protein